MMYFGRQQPLLFILSIFIIPIAMSLQLCDVPTCTCGYNTFGPVYFYVSCDVSSPDFNFAQFSIVTEFPSAEPYELELKNYALSREPFVIPQNAFADFVNNSPSYLGFYLIDNFAPISRGSLRGLDVKHVTFSGLAMDAFPSDALQDVSHSLLSITVWNVVPVSVDGTAVIFPPVHSFEVLERVTIEETRVASTTSFIFSNLPSLRQLKIANGNFMASSSGTITTPLLLMNLPNLRSLELPNNNLMAMPSTLSGLQTLKHLDLSYNNIQSLDANLLSKLHELTEIDVHGNEIATVDRSVLDVLTDLTNLRTLTLEGNPFDCRCDTLPFLRWLQEASLDIGRGSVSCKYPVKFSKIDLTAPDLVSALETTCSEVVTENPSGTTTVTLPDSILQTTKKKDDNVKPGIDFVQYHVIVPITVVSVVVIVAGIVSSLMLRKKLKRRGVGLFRGYSSTSSDSRRQSIPACNNNFIEINSRYDAYVCHHDGMAEFVALNMVPQLEQAPHNLRLCLSFRDFLVGVDHLDNVSSAMDKSRAIIVLLNREFINSGQCLLELNMACSQMMAASADSFARPDGIPGSGTRLLLVLMDVLPVEVLPATLRALLDKITCLQWDMEDEERCWGQLQHAVLARRQNSPID